MKKIISTGLLLLLAFLSFNMSAQDIQEIVDHHIMAVGGAENWSKLKSKTSEMLMKAQGAEIKVVMNQLHKKGMRVDIELMGMHGYQIITDKEGWGYMPFGGQAKPEPATAEEVKASQDDLDLMDKFITYKDYGKKIEYIGKDDMEGTECYKISMTDKDGEMTTFFLDASNYYIIKEVVKKKINGKEIEATTTYSNYKKLDEGVVMAMSSSGDQGEMEITKVEINKTIDPMMFQPKTLEELKK
jgi:hypothetical protein